MPRGKGASRRRANKRKFDRQLLALYNEERQEKVTESQAKIQEEKPRTFLLQETLGPMTNILMALMGRGRMRL